MISLFSFIRDDQKTSVQTLFEKGIDDLFLELDEKVIFATCRAALPTFEFFQIEDNFVNDEEYIIRIYAVWEESQKKFDAELIIAFDIYTGNFLSWKIEEDA